MTVKLNVHTMSVAGLKVYGSGRDVMAAFIQPQVVGQAWDASTTVSNIGAEYF